MKVMGIIFTYYSICLFKLFNLFLFMILFTEVGWEKQDLCRPIAGREGSEITKFAAELVKNGVYY